MEDTIQSLQLEIEAMKCAEKRMEFAMYAQKIISEYQLTLDMLNSLPEEFLSEVKTAMVMADNLSLTQDGFKSENLEIKIDGQDLSVYEGLNVRILFTKNEISGEASVIKALAEKIALEVPKFREEMRVKIENEKKELLEKLETF